MSCAKIVVKFKTMLADSKETRKDSDLEIVKEQANEKTALLDANNSLIDQKATVTQPDVKKDGDEPEFKTDPRRWVILFSLSFMCFANGLADSTFQPVAT